jgi:hypothetical protein
MIKKYIKKSIVVEAFQYFDDMGNYTYQIPIWFNKAIVEGIVYIKDDNSTWIKTLEGDHLISDKDYVIKGVKNELYPCKPDIFKMTYEEVI